MSGQSFVLNKAIFSLAVTLDLCAIGFLPTQAIAKNVASISIPSQNLTVPSLALAQYVPPKGLGTPTTTASGGTRGNCTNNEQGTRTPLTALVPKLSEDANWALTAEENPQIFVYVPETSARMGEFVLQDENRKDVYRTSFPISGKAGIVSFIPPKTQVKLEKNKDYRWFFTIFCNSKNRRRSDAVEGLVRRVELNSLRPNLASELEGVGQKERSQLYAQNGVWYDALATLAELRRHEPNDTALAQEWKKLLESAGLKELGNFPIIALN